MRTATQDADAYQYISALVYERSRIRLDESKRQLISTRLGKRLRQLGLTSLSDYCHVLRASDQEDEITHVINAISTNFTHFRVKAALRDRIRFQQLNLLGQYPFRGTYDVIFCRNVMIYFDRTTQEQLVNQLGRMVAPRGYLLIGHSESLNGLSVPFGCLRPSIYQKTA